MAADRKNLEVGVMSTFVTPIEIFNAALLRCGEASVSEMDDSAEAALYRGTYEQIVRAALCKHKWSFAQKTAILQKQGASGNTPKWAYLQPNDLILLHKVVCDGTFLNDVELRGGKILTNADSATITAHYTGRAEEALWADDFTEAMIVTLQGHIRQFQEDMDVAERFFRQANDLIIEALTRDRQSQAPTPVNPRPSVVETWRGGGRRA